MNGSATERMWVMALIVFLTVAGVAFAQHHHDDGAIHGGDVGHVAFGVDCDAAAEFDRALGLMHHMMYVEARGRFEAIAEREPACAMAYWGIATTLFQPLWPSRPSSEALQRGWDMYQRARVLVQTDRDRYLVDATGAFFAEPDTAEYWQRIQRWADGMDVAYGAFPDDLDVAALYALSLIALAPISEHPMALFDEAEQVLAVVFEREPTHPGAIHYAIHATDVEGRAANALEQVAAYGRIAPEVPHALHMPTHIYVRLGEWPGVIEWNRRSADAALNFPVGDRVSAHHIHALDYMLYAALQQGDDVHARTVLEEALSTTPYQEDFAAAFHLAIMPARYAIERRSWTEAAELPLEQPDYLAWSRYTWPQAIGWFARGLGAVQAGRTAAARKAETRLTDLRDQATAAGERAFATYIDVDLHILRGWLAWVDGDTELAVVHMEHAAALEGTVEKHPITPGALVPPYEALGDLLSELGRYDEALTAYEASDARWPERFNTLLGAARAALAAGREHVAQDYLARLVENAGDSARPVLDEVRSALNR